MFVLATTDFLFSYLTVGLLILACPFQFWLERKKSLYKTPARPTFGPPARPIDPSPWAGLGLQLLTQPSPRAGLGSNFAGWPGPMMTLSCGPMMTLSCDRCCPTLCAPWSFQSGLWHMHAPKSHDTQPYMPLTDKSFRPRLVKSNPYFCLTIKSFPNSTMHSSAVFSPNNIWSMTLRHPKSGPYGDALSLHPSGHWATATFPQGYFHLYKNICVIIGVITTKALISWACHTKILVLPLPLSL